MDCTLQHDNGILHRREDIVTDSRRLEWIFEFNPAFSSDHRLRTGSHWIVFYHDGRKCLSMGKDFRECIDNVPEGKYAYVD